MSVNNFYWQYGFKTITPSSGGTTKYVRGGNDNKKRLNQTDYDKDIQLNIDQNTTFGDNAKSAVSKSANTSYKGSLTTTTTVILDENGNVSSNYVESSSGITGFVEFDMYGDVHSENPFSSSAAQCFNRVSDETRTKFEEELKQLTSDSSDLSSVLEQMSDSEIMTLNHFAGNLFVTTSGAMYRQPTEEEYLAGMIDWIRIAKTDDEYLIRMEALSRLQNNAETPSEETLNIKAGSPAQGKDLFYKNSLPLSSAVALAELGEDTDTNVFTTAMQSSANLLSEVEDNNDLKCVYQSSKALKETELEDFMEDLKTEFGESSNIVKQFENVPLSYETGNMVALGVTKFEPLITSEIGCFTVDDVNYQSVNYTATGSEDFCEISNDGVNAVRIKTSEGNYMYIIAAQDFEDTDGEAATFDSLYSKVKSATATQMTSGDKITVPNLNFVKTMDYDDSELRCVDIQEFTLSNATSTQQTTSDSKFDFTDKEFVILFAATLDSDKPYYAIRVTDENKDKMFVAV